MSKIERFPRRHPLCTCPEITFANMDSPPDISKCQGGSIAHKVIGPEEVHELIRMIKAQGD